MVVTGATRGIGLAAARALGHLGARLTLVGRDPARCAAAAASVAAGGGQQPEVAVADLSSQAAVRRLADDLLERHERLDVLVNNAGAIHTRPLLTEDGIEATWAVNHLAPFLLTNLLLERLRPAPGGRVVTTASGAHAGAAPVFDHAASVPAPGLPGAYTGWKRYQTSKLANVLFTAELGRRLEGSAVTATCLHPGFVATGFNHNNGIAMAALMALSRPVARTPERGADTLVWLAAAPEAAGAACQGGYFVDRRRTTPSAAARDPEAARRLWALSEEQTGLAQPSPG